MVVALLMAAYFAGLPAHVNEPRPAFAVPDRAADTPAAGDSWYRRYVSDGDTSLVHAASLVELPDGRLRAFWFAGSREGAADVGIHSAVFDPAVGEWGPESRVLDRHQVARGLNRHVRKLGNVVPALRDGRLYLYVVTVSVGGWSGSRLAVAESTDLGESWQVNDSLVTSPFMNISTLVKSPPVRHADGSLSLPVYHELAGKFGEMVRLGRDHRILSEDHIGRGRESLQPLVLVEGRNAARALLRNASHERPGILFMSRTDDRGETWTPLADSGLPNPGSAVGGTVLGPDHWLLVSNHNAVERDDLTVLETRDGGDHWRELATLHHRGSFREQGLAPDAFVDQVRDGLLPLDGAPPGDEIVEGVRRNKCRNGRCDFQFDYPYVVRADNGDVHVLYTWNKTMIAHAWWQADGEDKP